MSRSKTRRGPSAKETEALALSRSKRFWALIDEAIEPGARAELELKKRGQPIGAYDVLIAGTALAHELILVASNLREFNRVEGLRLENWR